MLGSMPGGQPPSMQPSLMLCPVIRFVITSGARGKPSPSDVAESSSLGIGNRSRELSRLLPQTVIPLDTVSSSHRGSRGDTSTRSARFGSAGSLSAGNDAAGLLPLAGVPCCAVGDRPAAAWLDALCACATASGASARTAAQITWVILDKTVFLSLGLLCIRVHAVSSRPTPTQELQ